MKRFRTTTTAGNSGEEIVCRKLAERGYRIIARNVREPFAEIDIVASIPGTLVFVEVRTRTSASLGHPAATVTENKQRKIRRAAEAYIVKNRIVDMEIRFDVATIIWENMAFDYFENAF